jgi:osmotically-inducible protein OsmY
MSKSKHQQPLLNSLARGVGHLAGSVARVAQELTSHDPTDEARPASHRKRRAQTQKKNRLAAPSRRGSTDLRGKQIKHYAPNRRKNNEAYSNFIIAYLISLGLACTNQSNSYKSSVEQALQQADLKDVTVSEDVDKNTITLGGTLHTDDAKARAADIAKSAAGPRVVANEISVQPVGAESQAKDEAAALDDGIEKNYKAA